MLARDVMTPKVATVGPEDMIVDILEVLFQHDISAVPVVEDGRVLGIVSEGDLLRRRELGTQARANHWRALFAGPDALAREYAKRKGIRASDIMSTPAISVGLDTPLREIAQVMEERHIKRVLVLDNGKLAGVVTRADLVRALSWQRTRPPRQDDAAIRNTMRQRLRSQPWTDLGRIEITVEHGVVRLFGDVQSAARVDALRAMAESISGVTRVNCQLAVRPR
jgi:CBS domain-containing protein